MVRQSVISAFKHYIDLINPKTQQIFKVNTFWLRDHCRCSLCYNKKTHQISSNVLAIPSDIRPTNIEKSEDTVKILWNDGHRSDFSLHWLVNTLHYRKARNMLLWDTNVQNTINNVKLPLQEFLKSNGLKELLSRILCYGFGIVTDTENTLKATQNVVERLAPVQKTVFGEMWEVSNDLLHEDLAYTNVALEAHNDNTYFTEAAGLQVFHMLSHEGTGGETLLVDGFNAANNVRIANPEAFDLLCNTPIEAEYIEPGIHFSTVDTVIKVHPVTKELFQIRYNVRDRAAFNTLPQDKVGTFYHAYRLLGQEINKESNEFWLKLEPGSVIFIDNWRVLHGRASYTGKRHLCGCYIGRSDWLSKANSLKL